MWLFGSRANLNKRGGDVDLYVETRIDDPAEVGKSKLRFLTELEMSIGERKIDVVVKSGSFESPIHEIAKKEGIRLL